MRPFVVAAVAALAATASAATVKRQNLPCGATSTQAYTVKAGDTLSSIAKDFTSGICDIASYNQITNPNFIAVGQALKIPVNCKTPDNKSCLPAPEANATAPCVPGVGSTYTVSSGDTLTSIAKDFNITLASVIAANKANIPNPDAIQVGQLVNIPVCPCSECEKVGTYNIKSGDLFVDLAKTHKTSIGQIKSLNVGIDPTKLQEGQQIILPENCHNRTSTPP